MGSRPGTDPELADRKEDMEPPCLGSTLPCTPAFPGVAPMICPLAARTAAPLRSGAVLERPREEPPEDSEDPGSVIDPDDDPDPTSVFLRLVEM